MVNMCNILMKMHHFNILQKVSNGTVNGKGIYIYPLPFTVTLCIAVLYRTFYRTLPFTVKNSLI